VCSSDLEILCCELNRWYPVKGIDKDGGLIVPTGSYFDHIGYGSPENVFDLTDPRDENPDQVNTTQVPWKTEAQ
jgi:hypothetical protein